MKKIYSTLLFSFSLLLLGNQICLATDGYFSLGYGTKSKGMAGAGVAIYSNSIIGGNPAANVFLGKEFSIGIGLFSPEREYTISGNPSGTPYFGLTPGTVSSDKPIFFIPSFGGNWMINKTSAIGFSIYGNGGMNTNYPTKTFNDPRVQVASPTGINLSQLFSEITYSVKINEHHGMGISAIGAYQMFEATGLQAFMGMSSNPTKLTNNGTDNSFGFGFKIGYLGKLSNKLNLGAKYQSRIFMSEFKNYAGLFAQKGDFDVPANWTVGLAYQLTHDLNLAFDVKQILFANIKSIANTLTNNPLGTSDGPGFGWKDMMVYKLGMEYSSGKDWVWRAGYSYGTQPIPSSQMMFNILAPGVSQNHLAAGFTRNLDGKIKGINLSLMYSPANTVTGSNNMDPAQKIELKMSQFELELGLKF